jgi:ATP-dependent DNA helicase DinG
MTATLALPALHASHAGTWLRESDGATREVGRGEAVGAAADTPYLMVNAPLVATRLGYPEMSGLDLLELFAFVHPARFCVPTIRGIAEATGVAPPATDGDAPLVLQQAAAALIGTCGSEQWSEREGAWSAVQTLIGYAGRGRTSSLR